MLGAFIQFSCELLQLASGTIELDTGDIEKLFWLVWRLLFCRGGSPVT